MDSTTLSEIHRAAAELTTDFVFALRVTDDGRMRVQWVSPGIAGLTGFPVEEMGGPGGWEGLIPEEDRVVLGHRNETLLGGQTAVCEYRLVTRTGEVRWMRETSRPIRSAPGGPVSAVYGAACEITDHRQEVEASRSSQERPRSCLEAQASELTTANRQLQRELEECRSVETGLLRFKIIADEASYGIAIADLEGVLLYVNDGFARMHNHTPDELVGRHLSVFHTDEQLPRANALLDRLRKDGLVTVEEVWHKRRDGSVFPTLMNASVIEGEDGAPLFLSATAIDITEHRRAEEELRVSQQELQAIYDGVVDGILIADAETGALIRANSAMGGMLGYSEGELLGISVAEILPSEDRARLLAEFAEVAEGRRTFASEVPVACKDRNVLLVDISARPIRYRGRSCVIGFFRDVTERKRAEDAIRESERHLRSVLDGLGPHILVGVMTPDGVLIEANEPGLNIGNVKPEDVLGKPCEETYWFCHSPAVQQKLRDSIRRAAQGEPCRYDMVIRVGEDRFAVIDFSLRPLRDETGKITYLIPSATDITERTQAEDRLRASEARYRAIIEDQTELVCRCLPDKTHTFVNDAYCRCFGQTYEELIGCSIMPLIPEEHHARVLAHFAALSSECPVATYEHRVIVASGETRWHQWTDRAIFDAEGTIVEYQSVGRDITERRQVEIALRKSEERFRTLVDAGKDAVIAIDREGLITIFNPAAERMFGWRRAEVAGQPLDRLMPDEYRAPHREYVRGYFHTGNPRGAVGQTLELSAMRKGGSAFPIELSLSVGQHGNEPFALTVIRDITERKRAEEALRDSEERYRALFEQAPDAVVLIDGQNGALLEFNDRAHENLGYTRAEFQHLTLEEIRAGELPEGIASQIARIMEKGTETFDSKHRTKSGEIRDVRVTARAVTVRGRVLFQSVWSDITEQKRSEEARQRQALVFGNIYDGVLVTDLEGRITDWNPGAERMFGYSREEVLGRSPEILNRPQEAADVTRRIREAVNTTGRWSGELCYVRRDGTEGVCEVILVRLVDLYGQPVGNVSVNRDATERKRAEQALRESMDELARVTEEQRLLLTHTRDFVYRHNTEGVFTYLSPSIEQITGYTVEEWHTHYTTYMTDHPLNQKVRDYTEETLRTGRPGPPYLVEVRHKNGHHIMLEVNERPYHADGEVAGIIGVARDVTERVRIDQALRESERRFRLVTRATRDAIYDWDIIADRSWRNERYLEWFAPPADTSYDWWASRLHQDDRARVETSLREALDSLVDNWSTEYRLLRADEEYAHILARGWIMRDPTGRPLRMIGAMTDITERIKAEDLARRRQAELARVMRVNTMGEMAAGLAHELNQPLAAIANYAKGSLRRIECESVALVDLVEPIRRISEQASRAGEIIRRIREFVGQVEPRRSAVDLGEVIREVTSLAEYEARTRSIHIELELAAGLPPAYADRIQVQQVVLNLVRNALEASGGLPNADQAVTIATELSDCGGLLVAVRDQGAGIDPVHAEQIFEPFFTSRKTGMGMGLAICRSIVSGHGGRIWATPNPGGGTILSFTLPTASEPEAGQRQPASP